MLKKFTIKGVALTLSILFTIGGGVSAKTILTPDYGQTPPVSQTTSDIISKDGSGTNFAPVKSAGMGIYNSIVEWNGYLFAVASQGDNKGDTFKDSYIQVYDISSGGVGVEYARWTAQQLTLTDANTEPARPNIMAGIYVDNNCIYIPVYYGTQNNGIIYAFENNVGKANGTNVPKRLASDSVLNGTQENKNPNKISQFLPTLLIGNNPRWSKHITLGKVGDYLIGFDANYRSLTYIAALNVADANQLQHTGNTVIREDVLFKYNPIGGGSEKSPKMFSTVEFDGKYAYVICVDTSPSASTPADIMYILDFSIPTAPVVAGKAVWKSEKCDDAGNINAQRAIKISGNYAYVTTKDDVNKKKQFLFVLDISDKTAPVMISDVPGAGIKGGIPINLNDDGTVKDYRVGIGSAQIIGNYIVGFSTNNQAMDFYRIEMSPDKTSIKTNYSVTHTGSGITDQIRDTFIYGNKIYYNQMGIYSANKPNRLGYVTLTPEKTYGVTVQQMPLAVDVETAHTIQGTIYDGSNGNVDKIKLTIQKDSEPTQTVYVEPYFGEFGDNFMGKWSYTLPAGSALGNYKVTAEAAATWSGGENIDISGTAEQIEFSVKQGKRFDINAEFTQSEGNVTAKMTATNTMDSDNVFIPVMVLYNGEGAVENIKIGNSQNIVKNTENFNAGTISISNYSVGDKVKILLLEDITNIQPIDTFEVYPR